MRSVAREHNPPVIPLIAIPFLLIHHCSGLLNGTLPYGFKADTGSYHVICKLFGEVVSILGSVPLWFCCR